MAVYHVFSFGVVETSQLSVQHSFDVAVVFVLLFSRFLHADGSCRSSMLLERTPATRFVNTHTSPHLSSSRQPAAEHRQSCALVVKHSCIIGQTIVKALAVRRHLDRQVLFFPTSGFDTGSEQHFTQHGTSVFCKVPSAISIGFSPEDQGLQRAIQNQCGPICRGL